MNEERSPTTVSDLAAHVGGTVLGDGETIISGIANLSDAGEGQIAFVEDQKHLGSAVSSGASCLIVPEGAQPEGRTAIAVLHPKLAFAKIAAILHPARRRASGIDPQSVIAPSASVDGSAYVGPRCTIGDGTIIGAETQILAGTYIGDNVNVGAGCVLHPGVVLYDHVSIGDRVILHAGVVIGADGFGYVRAPEGYVKFPQIGTVEIEDDVEIGANSCIDRAALGRTRIGKGTKIDNLVQIAHNVEIGERVVIASQTGISGSTVVEDDAVIGGQVGMGDHARVQSGAIVGSKAGILPGKIVRPGVWWGIPVQRLEDYKRINAHVKRLPQLREELTALRRELEELKREGKR
jgi:UDP-3-O-[3-hydroxymyristoyl] glucosamine N-acyltransferase